MKQISLFILFSLFFTFTFNAQVVYNGNHYKKPVKPTKNVILMIPDGTSIGVVSAARWYQIYNNEGENLAIDPYICGTVKTFSSNAPIGDSAPTGSTYSTGMLSQAGNIAIYPPVDRGKDLVNIDSTFSYQPLATLLEAAKLKMDKATGLVVTVEFPHATPAGTASHHYDRGAYKYLVPQMVYQNLDVMFGGGSKLISDDLKQYFHKKNTAYYANDLNSFRNHKKGKIWSLWCDMEFPYALDRSPDVPSLQEMTEKAIELLSQNENGFFLMVEGSQVDWAAHANDAVGCITEYLDFDRAVKSAIDFAIKDGNTTVLIVPDHGNSGFTIGRNDLNNYGHAGIDKLFANVSRYKLTAKGLEKVLMREKPENFKSVMKQYTGIELTDEEVKMLVESENYKPENYMKVSDGRNMISKLGEIMNRDTYFGFTSGGHTGEEVFLAVYHPEGNIPLGMNTNIEINHYLQDALGLEQRLPELTNEIFAKHTDVFAGFEYTIDRENPEFPTLIVKKGRKTLKVPAFKSVVYLNDKEIDIKSVVVYIDKTDTFYLPSHLKTIK